MAEDNPIRGPAWSKAQLLRDSTGIQIRENKDLAGLQQHFNAIYDQFKKGVEDESAVTLEQQKIDKALLRSNSDVGMGSKKSIAEEDAMNNSTPSLGHKGAFAFLNARKK